MLSKDGAHEAKIAIMTTDSRAKEVAVEFDVGELPLPSARWPRAGA
jgi:N-acetylglutamate synthase/N-acetylornithine aminotransferase